MNSSRFDWVQGMRIVVSVGVFAMAVAFGIAGQAIAKPPESNPGQPFEEIKELILMLKDQLDMLKDQNPDSSLSALEVYRATASSSDMGDRYECDFDVPSGKRLIMDVLTFEGRGSSLNFSRLQTRLVGEATDHFDFPLGFTNFFELGNDSAIIQVQGPFYADDTNPPDLDGRDFQWALVLQDAESRPGDCSITGRLIPVPSP